MVFGRNQKRTTRQTGLFNFTRLMQVKVEKVRLETPSERREEEQERERGVWRKRPAVKDGSNLEAEPPTWKPCWILAGPATDEAVGLGADSGVGTGAGWTADRTTGCSRPGAGALGRHGSEALNSSEDEVPGCSEKQQNREPKRSRERCFLGRGGKTGSPKRVH